MIVRVRLFAVARQLAGRTEVALDLPAGATVSQLRARLSAEVPALAPVLPQVLFAIGSDYAAEDSVIPAQAEIACIPPVSGG